MTFEQGGPHEFPDPMEGYYWFTDGKLYIPFVMTLHTPLEGRGAVGVVIERAKECAAWVGFPTVISAKLDAMLARRGFVNEYEYSPEFGEDVEIRVWKRAS
jgi:hypothetical protein